MRGVYQTVRNGAATLCHRLKAVLVRLYKRLRSKKSLSRSEDDQLLTKHEAEKKIDEEAPRHPKFALLAERLKTFDLWPIGLPVDPKQLADAGFYYTGFGDRVFCFQCGGGLKDFGRGDLPWVEHASWFENCAYLNRIKGPQFVKRVQEIKKNQKVTIEIKKDDVLNTNISGDQDSMEVASLLRSCKICLKKELGMVFLPCGHMVTCEDCGPKQHHCNRCNAGIDGHIRVYLPE